MNKLKLFFSYNYLFTIDRVALQRTDKIALVVGIVSLVLGIVLAVMKRAAKVALKKELFWRMAKPFLFLGITELLWFGARYEYVSFFGSHFVAFLLIVIAAVWLGMGLKWKFKVFPGLYAAWEKEELRQKYLQVKR